MRFTPQFAIYWALPLLGFAPSAAGDDLAAAPYWARPQSPANVGRICTVKPLGGHQDDVPQILAAFKECNFGGTVVFPENETFWIAQKLNPELHDVTVEWRGTWLFSDDIESWRNNTYYIEYQNHWSAFALSGERIYINGYGTGGINGSGNSWYNVEQDFTQPGRPMVFTPWNVSDLVVQHFAIHDPPLWALNVMNGTNCWFDDIYVNATAVNAPWGSNWVQNTDGFDCGDSYNIVLTNFVYQGGDDAIAIKPRSYNVFIQNITIHGGNGVAIGSLGQYYNDASVENVIVRDARIITYNQDMHNGAYIKTWVGEEVPQNPENNGWYESGGKPRGGGWGIVNNIRFENFYIEGAKYAAKITQDSGNNGSFEGTSNMLVSNVAFVNFTGWLNSDDLERNSRVWCSTRNPCYNIALKDFAVKSAKNQTAVGPRGDCRFTDPRGVNGLIGDGC